jgi:ribosomal protein L37AE/L43A
MYICPRCDKSEVESNMSICEHCKSELKGDKNGKTKTTAR